MKALQEFVDLLNGCIQCARCKHHMFDKESKLYECKRGIMTDTKGKCEKFAKIDADYIAESEGKDDIQ